MGMMQSNSSSSNSSRNTTIQLLQLVGWANTKTHTVPSWSTFFICSSYQYNSYGIELDEICTGILWIWRRKDTYIVSEKHVVTSILLSSCQNPLIEQNKTVVVTVISIAVHNIHQRANEIDAFDKVYRTTRVSFSLMYSRRMNESFRREIVEQETTLEYMRGSIVWYYIWRICCEHSVTKMKNSILRTTRPPSLCVCVQAVCQQDSRFVKNVVVTVLFLLPIYIQYCNHFAMNKGLSWLYQRMWEFVKIE